MFGSKWDRYAFITPFVTPELCDMFIEYGVQISMRPWRKDIIESNIGETFHNTFLDFNYELNWY